MWHLCTVDDMQRAAVHRYDEVKVSTPSLSSSYTNDVLSYQERIGEELLVSGSDDFTLFLWQPTTNKKPLCRMTGNS